MLTAGEVSIINRGGTYLIKVTGRATFECAPVLRNLAKNLETEQFNGIEADLRECTWMDSTFMGILAMLGLRASKIQSPMKVINASEQNLELLVGLGLKKLFDFVQEETTTDAEKSVEGAAAPEKNKDAGANAQTVLEAHQTLMDLDEQNVRKFERVVNLVQQDIDRMNQTPEKEGD